MVGLVWAVSSAAQTSFNPVWHLTNQINSAAVKNARVVLSAQGPIYSTNFTPDITPKTGTSDSNGIVSCFTNVTAGGSYVLELDLPYGVRKITNGFPAGLTGTVAAEPYGGVYINGIFYYANTNAPLQPGGNQPITVSGDATGTGTTSIPLTLSSVGTAGTYTKVTTDAKGRVTSGTTLSLSDLPAGATSNILGSGPISVTPGAGNATVALSGTVPLANGGTGNTTGQPSGTAGGILSGTFPNPSLSGSAALPAAQFTGTLSTNNMQPAFAALAQSNGVNVTNLQLFNIPELKGLVPTVATYMPDDSFGATATYTVPVVAGQIYFFNITNADNGIWDDDSASSVGNGDFPESGAFVPTGNTVRCYSVDDLSGQQVQENIVKSNAVIVSSFKGDFEGSIGPSSTIDPIVIENEGIVTNNQHTVNFSNITVAYIDGMPVNYYQTNMAVTCTNGSYVLNAATGSFSGWRRGDNIVVGGGVYNMQLIVLSNMSSTQIVVMQTGGGPIGVTLTSYSTGNYFYPILANWRDINKNPAGGIDNSGAPFVYGAHNSTGFFQVLEGYSSFFGQLNAPETELDIRSIYGPLWGMDTNAGFVWNRSYGLQITNGFVTLPAPGGIRPWTAAQLGNNGCGIWNSNGQTFKSKSNGTAITDTPF